MSLLAATPGAHTPRNRTYAVEAQRTRLHSHPARRSLYSRLLQVQLKMGS